MHQIRTVPLWADSVPATVSDELLRVLNGQPLFTGLPAPDFQQTAMIMLLSMQVLSTFLILSHSLADRSISVVNGLALGEIRFCFLS